jgi:DNA-binding winged helix-turn-helix (wHTH) protein
MIYIIDGSITYNPDDCTLGHIPTEESVSLSISAGRLLERLLNSEGEILARDMLLTEVWDKYGLRGSNSNLNQYLSILRRVLAGYGCDNLIITIPKIGIRINTELKIERESSPVLIASDDNVGEGQESITAHEISTETVPPLLREQEQISPKPSWSTPGLLIAATITALLAGGAGWYYWTIRSAEQMLPTTTIKLEGGCEAVLLHGLDVLERKSLNQQIQEIIKENNQSCDTSHRFYFDNNTSFTTHNYGRTILSSCKIDSGGHVISCDNFYYLDWRMN